MARHESAAAERDPPWRGARAHTPSPPAAPIPRPHLPPRPRGIGRRAGLSAVSSPSPRIKKKNSREITPKSFQVIWEVCWISAGYRTVPEIPGDFIQSACVSNEKNIASRVRTQKLMVSARAGRDFDFVPWRARPCVSMPRRGAACGARAREQGLTKHDLKMGLYHWYK